MGEFRDLQDAIARLTVLVPAALALIAVLLYVQFNSLRDTLLIFGLLPLSCIGGVAALDAIGLLPAAVATGIGSACRSLWRWSWWAARPCCLFILVVFPTLIGLLGRPRVLRQPAPAPVCGVAAE